MEGLICRLSDFGIIPGTDEILTDKIQAVLDKAAEAGGKVIVPAGTYRTGGLLMHGGTELHLERGACLLGSDNPEDYKVFAIPDNMTLHTDMEMIPTYFDERKNVRVEYRRAIISVYGENSISITGEGADSVIDGADCFDPEGEEHLRGPHGIFLTNCKNIKLCNYTIKHCGNFHHQIDTCENITVSNLKVLGGHDGFHLHCCKNVEIKDSIIHSGDDCISGMNMENIEVTGCELNTSCQVFRMGGNRIHIENCRIWGPGEYPYRASVIIDKGHLRPREEWHTDIISLIEYFSSSVYPIASSDGIVLKNCDMENVGKLLFYEYGAETADGAHYCAGTPLAELIFENCRISGRCKPSLVKACKEMPLTVVLKNISGARSEKLFDNRSENLSVEVR